jgi:uncharacterized membrane protein YcjF (UPF0283 family)
MTSITAWFHSWIAHPYGAGATWVDYLVSAVVLVLVLMVIWKVIAEVRKAV